MITKDDIENLAELARIDVSEGDAEKLRESLEGILAYVSDVRKISEEVLADTAKVGFLRNVFREDALFHEAGRYTDGVLQNAGDTEMGYVKVRKIL